ncbi:hypothetical protein KFE25_001462 [Diacronema lutheri]|uniref:ATP-dependent Clp protease proteolytic subunit n=1 Tax=Diacronema lutheri TaxID=2081491 RepID=A0A8J5X0I9_DIALT|nr:hypothetical protein KFE25_001462 [Diacronema lutheri]
MGVLRRSWTLRRAVSTWTSAPVGLYDRHTSQPSWHVAAATPWSGWAAPPAPPPSALNIPYVVETTARGERGYDIFSRLLVERILCVNGPVDDNTSALVVAQLLYLDSLSQEAPIHMYINSPGGLVTAGLAIYDAMQFVRAPVSTLCVGQACSMASLLLAAGSPGLRRSLPNARIMVHQPHGGVSGQASDIQIHTAEMLQLKARLYGLFEAHSGRGLAEIEAALDRDRFLSAEEAVEFGLVDEVVRPKAKAAKALSDAVAALHPSAPPSPAGGAAGAGGQAPGTRDAPPTL